MLSVSTQLADEDSLGQFKDCLASVNFADEILLYALDYHDLPKLQALKDDYPQLKIIKVDKPKVIEYLRARQVKDAKGDWVLIMDFDEIITSPLKQEIIQTISKKSPQYTTYAIARQNFSLGYPLKYGGWGTDYVIRLFKKADFIDWPTDIHSTPIFKGELGKLESHMEHHKDESLEYIVNKTNRYTDQEAKQFYEGNLPHVTSLTLLRKLHMEMIRRGILRGGLLDGKIGIIQSIYQGFSVFLSWAKLYEKQQQ